MTFDDWWNEYDPNDNRSPYSAEVAWEAAVQQERRRQRAERELAVLEEAMAVAGGRWKTDEDLLYRSLEDALADVMSK